MRSVKRRCLLRRRYRWVWRRWRWWRRWQALTALEGTNQISILPNCAIHHPAFLLSHAQLQNQSTLAHQRFLLARTGTCSDTECILCGIVRARGSTLHIHKLSSTFAKGILRECEFVASAAQSKGELRELQLGGVRRRVWMRTESGKFYMRRCVLAFEGLSALDGNGGFQGVPL